LVPGQHQSKYKISVGEFHYRCKIDDSYVTIDLQQWYKLDIPRQFHVYNTLNTKLQFEGPPKKSIFTPHKDGECKPVMTIIWMADVALYHDEDYATYRLHPEVIANFLRRDSLWHQDTIKGLMAQRGQLLAQPNSKTKDIDFLPKDSLIFIFQKNIIKNAKMAKYYRWFLFSERTKCDTNKKEDFKEFESDEIFQSIIRSIEKSALSSEDLEYIRDETEFIEQVTRTEQGWWNGGKREGRWESERRSIEIGDKKIELKIIKIARELLDVLDNKSIADCTGLTVKEVEALRESNP